MDKIMIPKHQLEDFPELMHCIQSLLPIEEAARTSILSKSWLYAWSTNPTLRFSDAIMLFSKQPERRFRKLIDNTLLKDLRNNIQSDRSSEGPRIFSKQPQNKFRKYISCTLRRYIRDNIPIESFNLEIYIQDKQGAFHSNKWIRGVASKSCVKELYLTIGVKIPSLTLPDEIFSGANLNTISVRASGSIINPLLLSSNVVINCVSLRVLELIEVHMSEDVLNNLLSTCFMLEKINLCCEGVKTIKVKNLKSLRELKIASLERNNNLEIGDVPSLDSLFYYSCRLKESLPFNADSLGNLKELCLGGVIKDNLFLT